LLFEFGGWLPWYLLGDEWLIRSWMFDRFESPGPDCWIEEAVFMLFM
jgi:hypothetical protein